MTTRHTRQTFPTAQKGVPERLVGIRVHGVSWRESLEVCLGFLLDEDVSDGSFAVSDLEYLIWAANRRLIQAEKLIKKD